MTYSASGSCLCGAARFRLCGVFEKFYLCHCSRCRKDTGSDHAANIFLSDAELDWLSGDSAVRTFQLPGTRHAKSFCSICGSALPSLQLDGAILVAPAGCIDTPVEIRPEARIFHASRASWSDGLDLVDTVDELPQGSAALRNTGPARP